MRPPCTTGEAMKHDERHEPMPRPEQETEAAYKQQGPRPSFARVKVARPLAPLCPEDVQAQTVALGGRRWEDRLENGGWAWTHSTTGVRWNFAPQSEPAPGATLNHCSWWCGGIVSHRFGEVLFFRWDDVRVALDAVAETGIWGPT